MGVSIIPQVNKGSALTIGVVTPFFVLGALQFGKRSVFAHDFGGRIISGNFLPLMVGRTLAFHWRHDEIFGRKRWARVFEEEDTVKKNGNEKTFCTNDGKGMSLSTNDN